MASTTTTSIYDTITNQIIAALERGTDTFSLPWHRSTAPLSRPMNAATGKAYRGVNVLALWASAEAQDFGHGLWATYRQWQSLGAQVRKGEKASPIVFYKVFEKRDDDQAEESDSSARIFAQASQVFNASQVEGYAMPEVPDGEDFDPIPQAEAFVAATGALVRVHGDSAHYTPATDTITMPDTRAVLLRRPAAARRRTGTPPCCTSSSIGLALTTALRGLSASGSVTMPMPWRNLWPSSVQPSYAATLAFPPARARITPATSPVGSRCSRPTTARSSLPQARRRRLLIILVQMRISASS